MIVRVPFEVDITYVNGQWAKSQTVKNADRHYVIGFYKRDAASAARIIVLPDNKPETIHKVVMENLEAGVTIYACENVLPKSLKRLYDIIELKESDGHAKGDLHINHVKSMWRDLKRSIKREHVQVSQKHLKGYCDLITWHINHQHLTTMEKFDLLITTAAQTPHKNFKELTK